MAAGPKTRPQNRKRQHAEADLSQDGLPSKRFKPTRKHHSSNFPPEFYDSLSKVWLTRRALRELDRRNHLKSSTCAPAPAPKPVHKLSTRKELQRFSRHGGPELGDLRGYPEPKDVSLGHTMSSRRSSYSHRSSRSSQSKQSKSTSRTSNSTSKTSNTKRSRRSSAINADFEQHLIDHGIYIKGYEYPDDWTPEPSNLDWIRRTFATLRPSLSPSRFSNSDFRSFVRNNDRVVVEPRVMRRVLPTLLGDADILDEEDLLFTRLESITDNATVDPKPDFYDGARLRDIDKRVLEDIDEDIDNQDEDGLRRSFIIPTKHYKAPVAPNFFLEAKAPSGSADVLKRQACHDGAVGARAMHELQCYAAGKPVYDNNAYTLTATYHGAGLLQIYAIHVTPSGPGGSPEYHMTQIGGWAMIGDPDTYRRGAAALRHARELAQEWRDQFISAANERARSMNAEESTLSSSNYSRPSRTTYLAEESETSPDEFAATSFPNRAEEPEPSEDELAASYPVATSFSYYREGSEASEYEPGDASFYPGGSLSPRKMSWPPHSPNQ